MRIFFKIGLSFCWLAGLSAQPALQWQRAFGGSDSEEAFSVKQTLDGGY
jgi:hypothetical protein